MAIGFSWYQSICTVVYRSTSCRGQRSLNCCQGIGPTDTGFFDKAGLLDSKVYDEGNQANPADVASARYEALMDDKDMVVAGLKQKCSQLKPRSRLRECWPTKRIKTRSPKITHKITKYT